MAGLQKDVVADLTVTRDGDGGMGHLRRRALVILVLVCTLVFVGHARASRLLSLVDEQQGWMVGFGSDVYHTRDGGKNWQKQPTPANGTLNAVYFVDSRHGWAVGDRGTVLRTSDGGKKWSLCPPRPTKADLLDVFFYDAINGWAVGDLSTFAKTTDGGITWQVSQIEPLSGPLTGVSFDLDTEGRPRFGLVVGAGGGIFRTSNGGKTWLARSFQTANALYGVVAVNALAWSGVDWFNFAAGSGGTFVSCHHHNFDEVILEAQPNIRALDFVDDQVGWLVGQAGSIRKTNDGGKTWELQDVRPFNLQAIQCIDGNHAWVLSEAMPTGRILFVTTDGGATWNESLAPTGLASGGIDPDIPETAPDEPFRVLVPEGHSISNKFILPDRAVLATETSDQMSISACRGEYEPATFAIRSSVPLTNVYVQAGDLQARQDPGKTISGDALDVKWVKCWYQLSRVIPRGGLVPELLVNNDAAVPVGDNTEFPPVDSETIADAAALQPLNLAAGFTKQVWLTVHVPDEAEPGEYVARITITANGYEPRILKLRVQVLPFSLEPPMLDYGLYVNSELRKGELFGRLFPRTPQQLRSLMANLRAHGITHPYVHQPIAIWPKSRDPNEPRGKGTGGIPWREVEYDPTCLRKYLEILDELGFPKDKLFLANSYMMFRINYSKREKVGDPNVMKYPPEAFMPTMRIVTDLAKEFGYGEVYFYGMDEVSGEQLEFQRTLFEMMRKARTPVPAKTFCAAHKPTDVYDATTCGQFPSLSETRRYQATGRTVYIYANPHAGREQAYTYRRNVGLLLYKAGVNGTGWWVDYHTGGKLDYSFVYYTKTGQIDTLQWEGWREGCDDVRYLTTLHKALDAAKGKNLQSVSQARSWLAGLKITDDAQQVRRQAIAHIMALRAQ